jgi:hypothetical protein
MLTGAFCRPLAVISQPSPLRLTETISVPMRVPRSTTANVDVPGAGRPGGGVGGVWLAPIVVSARSATLR